MRAPRRPRGRARRAARARCVRGARRPAPRGASWGGGSYGTAGALLCSVPPTHHAASRDTDPLPPRQPTAIFGEEIVPSARSDPPCCNARPSPLILWLIRGAESKPARCRPLQGVVGWDNPPPPCLLCSRLTLPTSSSPPPRQSCSAGTPLSSVARLQLRSSWPSFAAQNSAQHSWCSLSAEDRRTVPSAPLSVSPGPFMLCFSSSD